MTRSSDWQPSASLSTLRQRAAIIAKIRYFFDHCGVLEVETPAMSHASVTDVHLNSFKTALRRPGDVKTIPLYLITSPEYHMKRLLAAGSGPIFQLCKSFRNEEAGYLHNPEFTLLEWYQFGSMQTLMAAVADLLQQILQCGTAEQCSYREIFQRYLAIDPLEAPTEELQEAAIPFNLSTDLIQENDRDVLLQLLFEVAIEPHMGSRQPTVIYHFPASQAALAQINPCDQRVAERFEVYYRGIELANGFHELRDAEEQCQRFQQDNHQRQQRGLPMQPIDQRLLAALRHGLPDCSGVAVGIDRLLMLALGATNIREVLAFDTNIA